jgi:DNA (cytosine-5)-methyltransferase 1
MKPASVVDLFCGVGGLTHGFVKEGFNVVAGIDNDSTCEFAYVKNNGARFVPLPVEEITADEIASLYPENHAKVLVGCAPCTPFSKYTNPKSKNDKWRLLHSFANLVRSVRPDIVSMENVPELTKHEIYQEFLVTLKEEGYEVSPKVVYCPDYGIPQRRQRLVLLASRLGKIRLISKTHSPEQYKTVEKVIGKLEPLEAGQVSQDDPLHLACRLSELNLRRIEHTPQGGSWKDWPEELILDCHKAATGKSYGSIYGRMRWNDLAPTMTTQCYGLGNGRFGHPEQHRAISLREAALFQTFPKDYDFIDPAAKFSIHNIGRHIGNAVPVRLGVIIARSIRKHLEVTLG